MRSDASSCPRATGGVGTIWWPEIDGLFAEPGLIDVAEIEPTTFWRRRDAGQYHWSATALSALSRMRQTMLLHSVGFPVGDALPDAEGYASAMRDWIGAVRAPWTSEHLSVQGDGEGNSLGFLMPLPQTEAWARRAADHIANRQAMLGAPFAFETGVNYFAPAKGEMTDGAFFGEIATRADCGVLLDLHNVWANARNGRQPVEKLLADLPLERVWELHVAGGLSHGDYWLDAHHGATPDAVIEIAQDLVPHLPNLGAIIFEINPPTLQAFGMKAMFAEIERLRKIWARRKTPTWRAPAVAVGADALRVDHDGADYDAYGRELFEQIRAAREPSFALYAELIRAGRLGVLSGLMPETIIALLQEKGVAAGENLLDAYLAEVRPQLFGVEEASNFSAWLAQKEPQLAMRLGAGSDARRLSA